jgi:hypothetical protein
MKTIELDCSSNSLAITFCGDAVAVTKGAGYEADLFDLVDDMIVPALIALGYLPDAIREALCAAEIPGAPLSEVTP